MSSPKQYEQYQVNLKNALGNSPSETLTLTKKSDLTLPSEKGYVMIKIHAAALNWVDLLVAANSPLYLPTTDGLVPLGDGAGEVIETSGGQSKWSMGDRVIFAPNKAWLQGEDTKEFVATAGVGSGTEHGILSQYVIAHEDRLVRAPANLTWEEAACLSIAGGTAWNALFCGPMQLKPGMTVLTEGTGGVSSMAIQLAKSVGANVIATSSSDKKLEVAKKLGATQTINYKTHEKWGEEALRLTKGVGVDMVVDVIGLKTAEQGVKALRQGGLISFVGFLGGVDTAPPDTVNALLLGGKLARGILGASRKMVEDLCRAVETQNIHPPVAKVFGWNEVHEAYASLTSGSVTGKVVIKVT
ncbi:NAD-P-binding protein [Xylogone sp. PMI_703]|nr:NAD-P-binding protein [Xylogone sp. PMI_703]